MNKLNLNLKCLTDKDLNTELVADLCAGVLKSCGIQMVSIEITKVAEAVILQRRVKHTSKKHL